MCEGENGKKPDDESPDFLLMGGLIVTSIESLRQEIRGLTMATLGKPESIVHDINEIEGVWDLADKAAKLAADTVYIDEGDTS